MRQDELMQKTITLHEAVRALTRVMNNVLVTDRDVKVEEIYNAFVEELGEYVKTRERCLLEDLDGGNDCD